MFVESRFFNLSWILAMGLLFASGFVVSCNNTDAGQKPPQPPVPQPQAHISSTYKSIFEQILAPKCVECHSGSTAPHGIDLSSYKNIMENSLFPPLVVRYKPEVSSLYEAVESGQMPKGDEKLSDEELKAIYDWIKTGALEFEGEQPSPTPQPSEPPDFN